METLASGYGLVEAPRVDGAGNLYFSDAIDGGVYRRAPDGAMSIVVPKRRGVGGLALHADGGVVISGRDVSHVRDGKTRILLAVEGVLGFNDLTTDAAGHVFVGSLRSPALQSENRVPGELWRIEGAGRAVEVYRDVAFANGVGFSPDGRTIYHSSYSEGLVLTHDLADDGRGVNRRVFARVPRGNPDGLAVDEAGGVWVALGSGGGIARFRPDGGLEHVLAVPPPFVAGLCFRGAGPRDLYGTTRGHNERADRRRTPFLPPPPADSSRSSVCICRRLKRRCQSTSASTRPGTIAREHVRSAAACAGTPASASSQPPVSSKSGPDFTRPGRPDCPAKSPRSRVGIA